MDSGSIGNKMDFGNPLGMFRSGFAALQIG
jgi:hypothetical protein